MFVARFILFIPHERCLFPISIKFFINILFVFMSLEILEHAPNSPRGLSTVFFFNRHFYCSACDPPTKGKSQKMRQPVVFKPNFDPFWV